jgi:hypothetical protein
LWYDNIGATCPSTNPSIHATIEYIEVEYHFDCERVAKNLLNILFGISDGGWVYHIGSYMTDRDVSLQI